MKPKNNVLFKRILSCVMAFAMLLPLCAMLIPVTVFADDSVSADPDPTPKVSLAWDETTVAVTDGVAMPHKNASVTASSYTMSYTVTASGDITTPITVRVQSFDLSAKAGKEYATVDTTVTLTAQSPSATGTVTVYTHDGYATRVVDTGAVYTNEFGLRITEITHAKKQGGADTLRAQVLAANGYTLGVVKNKDGANYGNGAGTFQNGYVYEGLERDYSYSLGTFSVAANGGSALQTSAATDFNPMDILNKSETSTLKALRNLYGEDILVYFSGYTYVNDATTSKTKGYDFRIDVKEKVPKVVEDSYSINEQRNWNNYKFTWTANTSNKDRYIGGYSRNTSLGNGFVLVIDESEFYRMYGKNYAYELLGNDKDKIFKNTIAVLAANNKDVVAESFSIEDRAYGVSDTIYLTVRFNKPVQFENSERNPLQIQARIGGSSANYFTYCGGNMTDTLIFSMTLPEGREISGDSIELVDLDNESYNKNIGDLFWNTSNKNNTLNWDSFTVKGKKFACSVDTRTPDISLREITGNSGTVKSAFLKVEVAKITNQGRIEVAWTKSETAPTTEDSWTAVTFLANEDDKAIVELEKKGLTGIYYAHLRASSVSGKQAVKTVGPFVFDNQSPTIKEFRLAVDDDAANYLKTHRVFFDISDVSVGVDEIYMKARHTNGALGLAGGVSELLVYKHRASSNLLTIEDGIAEIVVSTDLLDLADNSYDSYILEFYAKDMLENQSDVYPFPDALMFDNRDTFQTTLDTTSDLSIKGKEIYYNGKALTFSHKEEGSNELLIDSLKYNGVDISDRLSEYGMSEGASIAEKSLELSLGDQVNGHVEIVFKLGDRWSNVLSFYVTGRDMTPSNYQKLYANDRLLINEVWQLSTATFYSGNNRGGSYYAGTNLKPIFSSRAKALDYARFFEKKDVVIEYIDDEVEKNNLEGGWVSNYRKAAGDMDKVAAVGQTWLRYKSDSWTLGSNNEEHWVYYFYSDERETVIDPALTPSLNAAIDRNAKLICNYDGDNRIYLTANNTSKGYVNSFSEPYYDPKGILTRALSYQGCYSYEIGISADRDIYSSFITYDGQEVPLVANYTVSIDAASRGFVYCRQYGTEEWISVANGDTLKDRLKASGLYEVCEFGNGYRSYFVYVDLDAPVISYELTVDGTSKAGQITAATSGGTLRASAFTVKELLNSVHGTLPVERDRWAYFYILYSSLGGGEHAFMTMEELNKTGYSLETGIYKIYASDRLGNMIVQTIKINTEDIKVTDEISNAGLTITSNRSPSDIMPGTFKVWRDNMHLSDVTYAQILNFPQSGVYRVAFEDIYGNVFDQTYSFRRELPSVDFLREKKEGSGLYEEIVVNSEDTSSLSGVVSVDQQLFVVTTSADIRISYPVSSRYEFEFIGDVPEYKTSILSAYNIDIKSTSSSNWTLKIFHKNDPDIYIQVTCIVDQNAPVISANVAAKEYQFNEYNGTENVLFHGTGGKTDKSFYNGDRVMGDSVVLSWSDETQISAIHYTHNGGTPVAVSRDLASIELTEIGAYVFEVKDIYGNTATFEFTFTDRIDFSLTAGEKEIEIKRDPENYIVGDGYTDTVYTGRETRLTFREGALAAILYTDGSHSFIYNLKIVVDKGDPMLYVFAYDEESEEFRTISGGEISLMEQGTILSGDLTLNYTYRNGVVTLIMPECQKAYELWQIRVADGMEHCPVIVQIERSNKIAQMDLVKEDGSRLDLSYDGYIGSNQILLLDEKTVSDDTAEIVAYYSATYTTSFEGKERIVLYGKDATPFLEKEGYYRIVSTNKYGNEREYLVAIRFKLLLDVHISYEKVDARTETLKEPDSYSIFSNKSVGFVIWDERAIITCQKDGTAVEALVTRHSGYVEFALSEVGEYTVLVCDESENVYTLTVSIVAPHSIAYGGYLTGFNENALKKDQNYTNGALSLDKQKLMEGGIKYVAFRKVGTNQFSVLYDLIGVNPIEYTQVEYNGIIGREDGEYEVLFCDVYGNLCTETVRISRAPMIAINRQTQNSAEPSAYDFEFALKNGAWSNYLLTFINTSELYSLKVNGEAVSFGENGYTLMLPAELGEVDRNYVLEYVDDYGNCYTIRVYLHRAVPESQIPDGADTVTSGGKLYARNEFSLLWSDRVDAFYSLNGGAEEPFAMDKVFTEDGEYTFTFVDYAGNTSTRTVIKDSCVLYQVSCDSIALHTGAVVSSKVVLSLNEELTFTVTKDGKKYDNGSRSFFEDGVYVITLIDAIGNEQTFGFTIYAKSRQSFAFTVPEGYSFSQIWSVKDGHKVPLVGDVTLNEDGVQCYTFSADGAYEIELLHMESGEICCFSLTIDNIPPKVLLIGAKNGGVTRENVFLEGLMSGDMIYVYKNGELVTTYIVNGSSETSLELLSNGDFGSYTVVIQDEAGNSVTYEFVKEFATNIYSNIFICLLLMTLGAIGIIYIRFNGKVRTK